MKTDDRLFRLFKEPSRDDIMFFLQNRDTRAMEELFLFAGKVREDYTGNEVHLRGLIEFSSFCRRNCLYCGLASSHRDLDRYRLSPEEIVRAGLDAAGIGYQTLVLQSGEDPYFRTRDYQYIIRRIKEKTMMAVTLSIGEKSFHVYRELKKAGADRFLLKHETSDPELYGKLKPGRALSGRIQSIRWLKELGYEVGSGIMTGLPGQTLGSIADDILLFRELDVDMIGCGPFVPNPSSGLSHAVPGSVDLAYTVMALNRIVTRDTNIPFTTSMIVAGRPGDHFISGLPFRSANVLMPKLTSVDRQKKFDIYAAPAVYTGSPGEYRDQLRKCLMDQGYTVSEGRGNRVRKAG